MINLSLLRIYLHGNIKDSEGFKMINRNRKIAEFERHN
jgi:hypothetical protein